MAIVRQHGDDAAIKFFKRLSNLIIFISVLSKSSFKFFIILFCVLTSVSNAQPSYLIALVTPRISSRWLSQFFSILFCINKTSYLLLPLTSSYSPSSPLRGCYSRSTVFMMCFQPWFTSVSIIFLACSTNLLTYSVLTVFSFFGISVEFPNLYV